MNLLQRLICGGAILYLLLPFFIEESYCSAQDLRTIPTATLNQSEIVNQNLFDRAEHRVALLPQPATPSENALTLDDALETALMLNPTVRMMQSRIDAAHGRWYQAGRPNNPVVSYAATDIGEDGGAGRHGFSFNQTYITADKLALSQEVIRQEIDRRTQELAAVRLQVATDLNQTFIKVAIQQQRVATANDLLKLNQSIEKSTNDLLQAREINRNDFLQARLEAERVSLILKQAKIEQRGAWQQLAVLLYDPNQPERMVNYNLNDLGEPLDFETLKNQLLTESPQIAAAWAEVERQRWAVARACAGRVPNVIGGVVVQHDFSTSEVLTGVQLGMPIPYWNKNTGNIQSAQNLLAAAQRNVERLEMSLNSQLVAAYQNYQQAKVGVEQYSQSLLPKANEIVELVHARLVAGEGNYLELLTAQRTLFRAQLEYLDSLDRYWQARALLDGMLLNNHLDANEFN